MKMSTKKEMKPEPPPKPQPVNHEAMKGVWVDGISFFVSKDYVILEGVIGPPRAEIPCIVSRLMFPTRALRNLVGILNDALGKIEEKEKAESPKQ
jgi:hypothetical protein